MKGRLEVFYSGSWGTVCDDLFDDESATVVCNELGADEGWFIQPNPFGDGWGEIWLDDVQCTGQEDRLIDCPANDWGVNNCGHYEDVAISCIQGSLSIDHLFCYKMH